MEIDKKIDGNKCLVYLSGKMTHKDREIFKEIAFIYTEKNIKEIILDFRKLEDMDSNGIGMLLVLHEDASKNNGSLRIRNLKGHVKNMFEQAKLEQLFIVE